MGCDSCFQQIRLGEMLQFEWDYTTGEAITDPLADLSTAIDLGGGNVVGVSVTVCAISLGGYDQIDFDFETAPINNTAFYAGLSTAVTLSVTTAGLSTFQSGEGFSRFFMLAASPSGGTAASNPTLTATVDVIVRS